MVSLPNPQGGPFHSSSRQWDILKPLVREMRHTSTPAEQRLWQSLRNRQIANAKFRRQYSIDKFIVDFCCLSHRLVVEADGNIHLYTVAVDAARQAFLESLSFCVLRFTNDEIENELERVVARIQEALEDPAPYENLTPQPPLQFGEGETDTE